jgi:hypothetical protein
MQRKQAVVAMHDPLRRKGFFMQEVHGLVAAPAPEEWDSSVYMRSNGAEQAAEMAGGGGGGKGEGSGSSSDEGRDEAPGPECVVYVRGFQGTVADEATIKQRLRECFGDNGEVARIQLPCNRETGMLKVHRPPQTPFARSTHLHPTAAWAGCVREIFTTRCRSWARHTRGIVRLLKFCVWLLKSIDQGSVGACVSARQSGGPVVDVVDEAGDGMMWRVQGFGFVHFRDADAAAAVLKLGRAGKFSLHGQQLQVRPPRRCVECRAHHGMAR